MKKSAQKKASKVESSPLMSQNDLINLIVNAINSATTTKAMPASAAQEKWYFQIDAEKGEVSLSTDSGFGPYKTFTEAQIALINKTKEMAAKARATRKPDSK